VIGDAVDAENPPPPHHALVLRQFARIGIGPRLDVDAQPEAVKGLISGALQEVVTESGRRGITAVPSSQQRHPGHRRRHCSGKMPGPVRINGDAISADPVAIVRIRLQCRLKMTIRF
jgi:hypothetical protein